MNAKREKLTLNWRPASSRPPRRLDDYAELPAEGRPSAPPAAPARPAVPVAKCKPIRDRLENWARYERGMEVNMGGGGGDCMTGIVCERMRRAALGDVWSGALVTALPYEERDAKRVAEAWKSMLSMHYKFLLRWYYVYRAKPEMICRRLGIRVNPPTVFALQLVRAEEAIERQLDNAQRSAENSDQQLDSVQHDERMTLGGRSP